MNFVEGSSGLRLEMACISFYRQVIDLDWLSFIMLFISCWIFIIRIALFGLVPWIISRVILLVFRGEDITFRFF